jgi:O-antigen/teichoic acid export membrane protein
VPAEKSAVPVKKTVVSAEKTVVPAQEAPLRRAVLRGGITMAVATVAMRASSFLAQLVLGRLLLPEQFGVYAIAVSFIALANTLRSVLRPYLVELITHDGDQAGMYRVLMWSMWLATALALGATPWLAGLFEAENLAILLALMFFSVPFQIYPMFGLAQLNHQLDFRRLGQIMTTGIVVRQAGTVVGALLGWGVLSFAFGLYLGTMAEMLAARRATGPLPSLFGPIDGARLRLAGRSLRWLPVAAIALTIWVNGDYATAGLFQPATVVGFYFFAYQLTGAFTQPFTTAASSVLVPSFSRLPQGPRMRSSFLETVEIIPVVAGLPFGGLAVLAAPLVHLVWGGRWDQATIAIVLLAGVMPIALVHSVTLSITQARGWWKQYSVLVALSAVGTSSAAAIGGLIGGLTALVVAAVVVQSAMALVISCWVGNRLGVSAKSTFATISMPAAIWILAIALSHVAYPILETGFITSMGRLFIFLLASVPLIYAAYVDKVRALASQTRSSGVRV